MHVVTSAHGNQGKLLVPRLLTAGLAVRACVRTEASANSLRAAGVAEVVVGDLGEPGMAERAVAGAAAVYHIGPTADPREREIGFAMIDAARAHRVEHFVFSSVLHAIITDLVQHEIKRDVEEHLIGSGLEFTILQPTNYMLPLRMRPVFSEGVYRLPWSIERRQSLVDIGDVVEVAATVLLDPRRHAGATYELVGAERLTGHDLQRIISDVLGRPIGLIEIDAESYLDAWFGDRDRSQLQHQARVLRALSARYTSHDFVGNPNVLTWLLGRPPTSFAAFVETQACIFKKE
jgi:uncharacterized protein YbjT (DUF2867 family)